MSSAPETGLRVVLDTNVYVSAFTHTTGTTRAIWREAIHRRYLLLVSPAIISEIGRTLRVTFRWEESSLTPRLKYLTRVAEIISPKITLDAVPWDPSDNRILECAVEGRANVIVSGDRHLRRLRTYRGIPIVRPADFRRMLGAA